MKFYYIIGHNIAVGSTFNQVHSELQKGVRLARCRKCGCMRETLENLEVSLKSFKHKEAKKLVQGVERWLKKLQPLEYACLGCKHCIPAEAMNVLTVKFPSAASSTLSSCEFEIDEERWPPVAGEYTVLNRSAPVAVSTLSSVKLEEELVRLRPAGLCIVGKTETENIGIDKIVKNIITNPAISYLIVAGKDTKGHKSGRTLLALWENGVNKEIRVMNSQGRRPILKNVTLSEVESFRRQIQVDNLIGCENPGILAERVESLSRLQTAACPSKCGCRKNPEQTPAVKFSSVTKIKAHKPKGLKLDKAGYFVIIPLKKKGIITVEHYNYQNKLLRIIEGRNSRDICHTIVDNNWISDLSHAVYLGKEVARAELAVKMGIKYVQEGA